MNENKQTTHIRAYRKDAEIIKKLANHLKLKTADIIEYLIYFYFKKKQEEKEKLEEKLKEIKNKP
jgi:predicted solute-binding protein